jgi:hypothetical protein
MPWSGALAILGRAVGAVCGSDRDLRQNRRREREFRLGDANPYAGRDMRARAYRICDRTVSGPVQDIEPHVSIPPPFGPRYRRILALLFSRPQARQRGAGGADRKAQRRHYCDTWCRVAWRKAFDGELARRFAGRGRSDLSGAPVVRRGAHLLSPGAGSTPRRRRRNWPGCLRRVYVIKFGFPPGCENQAIV